MTASCARSALGYTQGPGTQSSSNPGAGSVAVVPVSIDEVLLRGCTLRNSGRVAGLVVYTGAEARIQMNAATPPRKRGAASHCARTAPLARVCVTRSITAGGVI